MPSIDLSDFYVELIIMLQCKDQLKFSKSVKAKETNMGNRVDSENYVNHIQNKYSDDIAGYDIKIFLNQENAADYICAMYEQ